MFIVTLTPLAPVSTNTIDNPRLVLHRNDQMLQIKWQQYVQSSPKLVTVFKITNYRQSGSPQCIDIDWAQRLIATGFTYCYTIYVARLPMSQWVTATDKNWHSRDRYYIIQYDFTAHNAPYGPYIAR